jgi:hypothetical protein
MNDEIYFVIFPGGDRTKIDYAGLSGYMLYEKNDYAVASRKEFYDEEDCIKYAKDLAIKNNLSYVGNHSNDGYLD